MNLAYRWFCRLGLEDRPPDHSSFSVNRHGRFRDSDILRTVFKKEVVCGCMKAGLVGGEGFAVDASVIEADVDWGLCALFEHNLALHAGLAPYHLFRTGAEGGRTKLSHGS